MCVIFQSSNTYHRNISSWDYIFLYGSNMSLHSTAVEISVLLTITWIVGVATQGVSGLENTGTSADSDIKNYAKDADYIGCFSRSCLTFDYHVNIPARNMTPDDCTSGCRDNRFPVAALYNFSKCSCACEQTCSAQHRQDHSCGLPCRGSPQGVYCGGFTAANVYKVDLQNAENIKCDRNIPTSPENDDIGYTGCFDQSCMEFDYNINMTVYDISPSSCTKACRENGFPVAALYNRTRCSCSCVHSCTKSVLPNEHCGIPCIGEVTQLCGGYTSASVYSVKIPNRSNDICTEPNDLQDSRGRKTTIAISLTIVIVIVVAVVLFVYRIRSKEIKWPITKVLLGRESRPSSMKVRYWMSSDKDHHCDIQRGTALRRSPLSTTASAQRRPPGLATPSLTNEAPHCLEAQDTCEGTHCANKSSEPWTSKRPSQRKHMQSCDYQYSDHETDTGSTRSSSRCNDGYDYVSLQVKNIHLQKSKTAERSQVKERLTSLSLSRSTTMDHSAEIHRADITNDIQEENDRRTLECGQYEEVGRRVNLQEYHTDSTTNVSSDNLKNSGGRFIQEKHYNEKGTISNVNHNKTCTVLNDNQNRGDSFYPRPHYGETLTAANENLDRPDATDRFAKYKNFEDTDSGHLDESYENVTIQAMDDTKLKCGKGEDDHDVHVYAVSLPADPHTYDVRIKPSGFQETGYQGKGMTPCQNPQKLNAPTILPKPSRRKNAEVSDAENERLKSSSVRDAEDVYAEAHYGQTSQASSIKQAKSKPLILQKPEGKYTSISSATSETPQNSPAEDFYAEAHYGHTSLVSRIKSATPYVSNDSLLPDKEYHDYTYPKKVSSLVQHVQGSPMSSRISKDGYLVPVVPSRKPPCNTYYSARIPRQNNQEKNFKDE